MVADHVTCPDDFDPEDVDFVRHLVPDGSFVTDMIVVTAWMDSDGDRRWRCYNATAAMPLTSSLGLLELAQLDMITRADTGLRFGHHEDDE